MNPLEYPCGGALKGPVHLDAEAGTREFVTWKTRVSAADGQCTIRLAEGPDDDELDVIYPLDGTGTQATNGAFPCGRTTGASEGKEILLPRDFTCDSCFIQVEFESHVGGKQYMCADVRILHGSIPDCSG